MVSPGSISPLTPSNTFVSVVPPSNAAFAAGAVAPAPAVIVGAPIVLTNAPPNCVAKSSFSVRLSSVVLPVLVITNS